MSDKLILTHKIEIKPNKTTIKLFNKYFGYSRFVYNKSLNIWNEMYEKGLKPNFRSVRDEYKHNRKEKWELDYSPLMLDESIEDVSNGWKFFFKGLSKRPKFKSKKNSKNTFRFKRKNDSTIKIIKNKLRLPTFPYLIKLTELPRYDGVIKTCTISYKAGKYFASLSIELSQEEKDNMFRISKNNKLSCGIDLGIKTFATLGYGKVNSTNHTKAYKGIINKLIPLYSKIDYYNNQMSKKIYNSNKYNVMKTKLQKLYMRISNIQKDYLNKLSTKLIKAFRLITIEDLSSTFMLKNKRLAKIASRSLFYTFRVMLKYKCNLYGNELVIADRHFASTQICSSCGNRKYKKDKLVLGQSVYKCDNCGEVIDRDENASYNLKLYGEKRVKL